MAQQTIAPDTQHYAAALKHLHNASLSVLDALEVQTESAENADAYFSKHWKALFEAVEDKIKAALADAASEHALDAAVNSVEDFAL